MAKKEIVIDFDENGDPTIDGKGFVGPECSKFLSEVQSVLGGIVSREQKTEYRQRVATGGRNTQRAGG